MRRFGLMAAGVTFGRGAYLVHPGLALMVIGVLAFVLVELDRLSEAEEEPPAPGLQEHDGGRRGD